MELTRVRAGGVSNFLSSTLRGTSGSSISYLHRRFSCQGSIQTEISYPATETRRYLYSRKAGHRRVSTQATTPEIDLKSIKKKATTTGFKIRKVGHGPFTRVLTIETHFPSDSRVTSQEEVAQSLEKNGLRPTPGEEHALYSYGPSVVIILATPSFASWLDDAGFISMVLKNILRPAERNRKQAGPSRTINVVCACVDGLSPSPGDISKARGRPAPEGFSVLYGSTAFITPELMLTEPTNPAEHISEKPASLTFQTHTPGTMDVTVPLANTLFKNGRLSTLLSSRWEVNSKTHKLSQLEPPIQRNNLKLRTVLGGEYDLPPKSYIPATPLTLARPIGSGLGNIVRTVLKRTTGTEEDVPASKELEQKVDHFLKNTYTSSPTIPVWALVIPEDVVDGSTIGSESTIRLPQNGFKRMYDFEAYREVGHWVEKGAMFCRVLSGGGGWGVKVGLLSLDPQTSYASIAEAWLDAPNFSTTSPSDQQITALGNIAKPGSYIQFFTTHNAQSEGEPLFTTGSPRKMSVSTTIVGTVPSTIDDIPTSKIAPDETVQTMRRRIGEFGCVSESGLFIQHTLAIGNTTLDKNSSYRQKRQSSSRSLPITRPSFETKLDLPYSYIYQLHHTTDSQSFQDQGRRPKNQFDQGKSSKPESSPQSELIDREPVFEEISYYVENNTN